MLFASSLMAQQPPRKKVAVVLSGGGAKGMAHIGALKVIEAAGIPVDIVTGTSMGSIIGGLYAIGYDADHLDSMVRKQNWNYVLSDRMNPMHQTIADRKKQNTYIIFRDLALQRRMARVPRGVIEGKNLSTLFKHLTYGYTDSIDFNKLPIPFACVATNIVDNTEYVFHSGILAEAMRASMSIPGMFSPIRKNDMLLVDGGLRNNFPVDVARQMGADIVIGVTVPAPMKTADELNTAKTMLQQIVEQNCKNKYEDNKASTNILIEVDTHGYSAANFNSTAIDTMIRRGKEAAMRHWDELKALKNELTACGDTLQSKKPLPPQEMLTGKVKLNQVKFVNVTDADEKFLRRKYRLQKDSISATDMDRITTFMRNELFYGDADYMFDVQKQGYDVIVTAKDKKKSRAALGVRFDTEEMVSLQANSEFLLKTRMPMHIDVTLRLGKRMMSRCDMSFMPWKFGMMHADYIFRHHDINLYQEGKRLMNVTFNQHTADIIPVDVNIRNFNVKAGLRWDYYHFNDILIDTIHRKTNRYAALQNEHELSYRADVDYNSENSWNFPQRGARFHAGYGYYTDNLLGYNHSVGIHAVNAMWRMSFGMTKKLTFQPMIYGRMVFGDTVPMTLSTVIGGDWFGHYFDDRHLPFAGVGFAEFAENKFFATQLQLQNRVTKNNYILLKLAAHVDGKELSNLLERKPEIGAQLSYYYNSFAGPLGFSIGWSSITRRINFYVNLGFEF